MPSCYLSLSCTHPNFTLSNLRAHIKDQPIPWSWPSQLQWPWPKLYFSHIPNLAVTTEKLYSTFWSSFLAPPVPSLTHWLNHSLLPRSLHHYSLQPPWLCFLLLDPTGSPGPMVTACLWRAFSYFIFHLLLYSPSVLKVFSSLVLLWVTKHCTMKVAPNMCNGSTYSWSLTSTGPLTPETHNSYSIILCSCSADLFPTSRRLLDSSPSAELYAPAS